jgi:DNA processing protein
VDAAASVLTGVCPPVPPRATPANNELPYWVALSVLAHQPKAGLLGRRTLTKLLARTGGSARALWEASPAQWQAWWPTASDKASRAHEIGVLLQLRAGICPFQQIEQLLSAGITPMAWGQPGYPPLLHEIPDAPLVFYVRGNLDACHLPSVGFVGTRKMSLYGQRVTEHLIRGLAPDADSAASVLGIISGMATGIDACAHQAALQAGLPTVAVFGTSVDTIYPAHHRPLAQDILAAGGAWLSEYPPNTPGQPFMFRQRNRLISGLSLGVVVVEGGVKSGSLITARYALEQNRVVMTVPGSVFDEMALGPLYLLREGALPVTSGNDIRQAIKLEVLGGQTSTASSGLGEPPEARQGLLWGEGPDTTALPGYSLLQTRQLWQHLGREPQSPQQLAQASGLAVAEVTTMLGLMEMMGRVRSWPGNRYSL